jgi:hypothetical protein
MARRRAAGRHSDAEHRVIRRWAEGTWWRRRPCPDRGTAARPVLVPATLAHVIHLARPAQGRRHRARRWRTRSHRSSEAYSRRLVHRRHHAASNALLERRCPCQECADPSRPTRPRARPASVADRADSRVRDAGDPADPGARWTRPAAPEGVTGCAAAGSAGRPRRALMAPGVTLWNVYGPTETTVWSAAGGHQRGGGGRHRTRSTTPACAGRAVAPAPMASQGEVCLAAGRSGPRLRLSTAPRRRRTRPNCSAATRFRMYPHWRPRPVADAGLS